jgi:diguanylate cyclase (GGDEF)-like protein
VAALADNDTFREEPEELSSSVARGPRNCAAVTVLRGDNPGSLYPIEVDEAVIGRSPEVEIPLPDNTLSRQHARIVRARGVFCVEDLGSTNGTFVDGERVHGQHVLEDGCRIHLGSRTVLHFRLHDEVELRAAREAYALTVRDPLTGIYNRRHLQERLESETAFARRHKSELSLILLDIDHFKRINDEHGHSVGDEALRTLAKALLGLTREEDVLARYGGEEFALIVRGIDREHARRFAERMRSAIESQRLLLPNGELAFTVSIGIAHMAAGDELTAQRMFEAAARALYASQHAGRNVVSMAPPGDSD